MTSGRRLTPQERMHRATSEAAVMSVLGGHLDLTGFLWNHNPDSRRGRAGLPDVIAVHPKTGMLAFIECKKELGKLRPEQTVWGDALSKAQPPVFLVCRPSTLGHVNHLLTIGGTP